jgi:hypothetical protein
MQRGPVNPKSIWSSRGYVIHYGVSGCRRNHVIIPTPPHYSILLVQQPATTNHPTYFGNKPLRVDRLTLSTLLLTCHLSAPPSPRVSQRIRSGNTRHSCPRTSLIVLSPPPATDHAAMRFAVPDSDSDDLVSLDLSYLSDTSEGEYDDLPGPSEWVFAPSPSFVNCISSLVNGSPPLSSPALASWRCGLVCVCASPCQC